ncbi:gp16 family protein [Marinobacterium litorale]|uniref:gp16 family protein n=1 Tax=Marinobacterium litorale TaxID=404770 RepID=UPI0003FF2756|nr:regulatory protein GemA [Marinobacterium litorale]
MTAKDNRKAALAQIHIAKKQLGLDDDIYREMLENITGKRSCSGMAIGELYQVIKHLENVGFKRNRGGQPKSRRQQYYSPKSKGQIIDVMRAIWIEMHQAGIVRDGSELALTHWAKRASSKRNGGVGVDSLDWLERDTKLASQVLEDLKQWNKRVHRQWQKEDFALIQSKQVRPAYVVALVRQLLAEHRIMWWPEFDLQLGIENDPDYCTNREELNRGD